MEITLSIDPSGTGRIIGTRDVVTTTPPAAEPEGAAAMQLDGGSSPALGGEAELSPESMPPERFAPGAMLDAGESPFG